MSDSSRARGVDWTAVGSREFLVGVIVLVTVTVLVQLTGVYLVAAGSGTSELAQQAQVVEDRQSSGNALAYAVVIGLGAMVVLALRRVSLTNLLDWLAVILVWDLAAIVGQAAGLEAGAAAVGGVAVAALYALRPRWWFVSGVAIIFGIYGVVAFGANFAVEPALVLLAVTAVYDLWAVFGSGHMQTLAGTVANARVPLPAMLVVPTSWAALRDIDAPLPVDHDGVISMGLGDVAIPGVMATSAALFGGATVAGVPVPALGAILGSAIGVALVLYVLVETERMLPGLPFINTGAAVGFVLGVLLA